MVGREASCPGADVGGAAMLDRQISIEFIISRCEEYLARPLPAARHDAANGNDNAGKVATDQSMRVDVE